MLSVSEEKNPFWLKSNENRGCQILPLSIHKSPLKFHNKDLYLAYMGGDLNR